MKPITRRDLNKVAVTGLAAAAFGESTLSAAAPAQSASGGTRGYRYVHLDVFTNKVLTGNQLAVFLDPAGLDTSTMQDMAREMNFSESTFVFPAEDPKTDVRMRIFGPNNELQFAGHPVIGSTFALAHEGRIKAGQQRFVFGLGVGPTPVDLEWKAGKLSFAWMTQLLPTFGKTISDLGPLAAALGIDASAITNAPQEVGCGSTFLIVPVATRQAVDSAALDRRAMEAVFKQAGMDRRGVFIFSTERGSDDATAYSRMLSFGVTEDPATGSATGPLGSYLAHHKLVSDAQAEQMISIQGVKMKRPSRLFMNISAKAGEITRVRVGGESVVVGTGIVNL